MAASVADRLLLLACYLGRHLELPAGIRRFGSQKSVALLTWR
jgi:hypothetical protein